MAKFRLMELCSSAKCDNLLTKSQQSSLFLADKQHVKKP